MTAVYNDSEPFVADWLEDLIAHDLIAPGRVDRRSITDLTPADVAGPGQRHFFAGIGGWSYALRMARVPDHASIWTGSCPCQPLSDAGQGRGFSDPRHLWPAWFALIRQCLPPIIFGEQVASALGLQWLDLVFADLEGCGYTVGAADLCAAGVGAPHIRQRLYFVAYAHGVTRRLLLQPWGPRGADAQAGRSGEDRRVADAPSGGRREGDHTPEAAPHRGTGSPDSGGSGGMADARRASPRNRRSAGRDGASERRQGAVDAPRRGRARRVANGGGAGLEVVGQQQARRERSSAERGSAAGVVADAATSGRAEPETALPARSQQSHATRLCDGIPAGITRGFWADAEWLLCRDPSGGPPVARPIKPGLEPLASGVPERVGLLSGYGNSIVPQVAVEFIGAALECLPP